MKPVTYEDVIDGSTMRATGCIKFFLRPFNWGYVVRDDQGVDDSDVFFHATALSEDWEGYPEPNASVVVEYERSPKGYEAISVKPIDDKDREWQNARAEVDPADHVDGSAAYVRVIVRCPHCGHEAVNKAGVLGKKMQCAACSKMMVVPGSWK